MSQESVTQRIVALAQELDAASEGLNIHTASHLIRVLSAALVASNARLARRRAKDRAKENARNRALNGVLVKNGGHHLSNEDARALAELDD